MTLPQVAMSSLPGRRTIETVGIGGNEGGQRLESAHRARARSIGVREPESLPGVVIELGREIVLGAVELAELGAEGLARHNHHIHPSKAAGARVEGAIDTAFVEAREAAATRPR